MFPLVISIPLGPEIAASWGVSPKCSPGNCSCKHSQSKSHKMSESLYYPEVWESSTKIIFQNIKQKTNSRPILTIQIFGITTGPSLTKEQTWLLNEEHLSTILWYVETPAYVRGTKTALRARGTLWKMIIQKISSFTRILKRSCVILSTTELHKSRCL